MFAVTLKPKEEKQIRGKKWKLPSRCFLGYLCSVPRTQEFLINAQRICAGGRNTKERAVLSL